MLNAVIIKYMHNILNTLWEWTEGCSKTDFGPAKAVGRSQTWPVELLATPYSYLPLVFLLYLLYITGGADMKTYSFPYDYKSVDVSIDERFVQGVLVSNAAAYVAEKSPAELVEEA